MRRFHVFLGGYVAVVFLAVDFAWSQAAPDPKLVEGARKEREVVWYTTTNLEPAKRIIDLFQKKYPFLTVNIYRTNVAPLISRVLLEARAGKYGWDVLSGGGELFPPVMERGFITQYRSPEAKMVEEDMVEKKVTGRLTRQAPLC